MSTPMSKRNLWMLRGIVTLASVGVVTLLAWLFLPPSFGTFVSVSHLDYFKDMSDPGGSSRIVAGCVYRRGYCEAGANPKSRMGRNAVQGEGSGSFQRFIKR